MSGFVPEVPRPATHKVPSRLNRKTALAAQLLGLGYTLDEVAQDLGMEKSHLRILVRSRLFQSEMERARNRFVAAQANDIKGRFHARTPHMMDRVEELVDDPKTPPAVVHAIARDYYGRIVPMKEGGTTTSPTIVINLSTDQLKSVETVLAEAEVVPDGDSGDSSDPEWGETSGSGSAGSPDSAVEDCE